MVTGGGISQAAGGPGVKEAAPGGMLPAGAPEGAGRVRRPADLLFAVLSLVNRLLYREFGVTAGG